MSKRMRLLRLLTKVPLVVSLIHLKSSYNVDLGLANHSATETALVLAVSVILLPM